MAALVMRAPTGVSYAALGRGKLLPVTDGLEGMWLLGGDPAQQAAGLAASVVNQKPGGAPATLVGTPIVGAGYVECTSSTNFLQTSIIQANAMTAIWVMRAPSDVVWNSASTTGPIAVSNYHGTRGGILAWVYSGTAPLAQAKMHASAVRTGGALLHRAQAADYDQRQFRAYAATWVADPGAGVTLWDLTAGTPSVFTAAADGLRVNTTDAYRIGSSAAGNSGRAQIAAVALHSKALDYTTQILPAYAWLKDYLSRRWGIAV